MKSGRTFKACLFSLSTICISHLSLFAQGSSTIPSSSSIPTSSTIQSMPQLPAIPSREDNRPIDTYRPKPIVVPQAVPKISSYFHPGILVSRNSVWEGSDHLLNISNQIGVYVEILKPENDRLEISREALQKKVEAIFAQFGISPVSVATPDQPPLPAFQIKLFLFPIDRGYAAYCEGRLFESVSLKRFILDPAMAFQAITWQRQSLIVAPTDKILEQIDKQVGDIAQSFAELFQIYERRKQSVR